MEDHKDGKSFWKNPSVVTGLLAVIALILFGWALKATFYVSMPLACAFFLAAIVRPMQKWLDDRLPDWLRWLSITCAMLAIVLTFAVIAAAIWFSIDTVSGKFPEYLEKSQKLWEQLVQQLKAHNLPIEGKALQEGGTSSRLVSFLTGAVKSVWEIAGFFTLVFFLVLLMLLETGEWRKKSRQVFHRKRAETAISTVETIAQKVRQYIYVRTVISAISAVVEGAWLWIMGVDFALVWAILFFVLNYLPNFGSIIAGIPPIMVALMQFNLGWALLVIGGLLVLEQVLGNFIDPKMQGKTLELSPFVILVSLIFWGWVWGIVGAFLAVPLTVTIIIICSHIEALKPVAIMLSRTPEKLEE